MSAIPQFSDDDLLQALQRCENEPIHQIGQIQPHGALIAFGNDPGRTVLQVSANLSLFFDTAPEAALGRPVADLIGEEQIAQLESACEAGNRGPRISQLIYSVASNTVIELQAMLHCQGNLYILEVEPTQTQLQSQKIQNLFGAVHKGLWALDEADGIVDYCGAISALVRKLIDFDRVMIYRFDADWEGEVIAESRAEGAASYLGNRFPAGDIPPQARALYTRNLLRVVADVEAAPVPVVPSVNPSAQASLDLSFSVLRAFSPVHVEYLRNMEVRASASISILHEGRLWGLIACHHGQPAYVSHPAREMLEFVGKIVSLKLAGLEADRRIAQADRLGKTMASVVRHVFLADVSSDVIRQHETEILQLVNAGGALLLINGTRHVLGSVPDEAQLDQLLHWLEAQPPAESFVTDHLAAHLPGAEAFADSAAGCFATPLSASMDNALIWFRPEKLQTINWAGKPDKDVQRDASGALRISPRKSFAVWTEIWRDRSEAWLESEIHSGKVLAEVLIDVLLSRIGNGDAHGKSSATGAPSA